LEFGDVGFGWAGRRLAFEESNVLAVDLLCPFDVVSSDGTVENVVIVQNVEETAESGTPSMWWSFLEASADSTWRLVNFVLLAATV
jgi:hypothetical protein